MGALAKKLEYGAIDDAGGGLVEELQRVALEQPARALGGRELVVDRCALEVHHRPDDQERNQGLHDRRHDVATSEENGRPVGSVLDVSPHTLRSWNVSAPRRLTNARVASPPVTTPMADCHTTWS